MLIRSSKITRAAQGEACTVQVLGICNHNPETTIPAHLPDISHGMALKASDIFIVFACHACHECIDRRRIEPEFEERREWYMLQAYKRTIARLFELGVFKIA